MPGAIQRINAKQSPHYDTLNVQMQSAIVKRRETNTCNTADAKIFVPFCFFVTFFIGYRIKVMQGAPKKTATENYYWK
jgi:hypothetical protein